MNESGINYRTSYIAGFLLVILLASAVRVGFLLTTERTMDKDECIVGVMIKGIAERHEKYVHISTGNYGGGHAFIAHSLALLYPYFGNDELLIQGFTALFSVLTIACVIYLSAMFFGPRAGLMTGLLLAFFPSFFKASFRVNGYIETLFFSLLSGIIFAKLLAAKSKGTAPSKLISYLMNIAVGALAGLALWSFSFSIIFTSVIVACYLWNIKKFSVFEIFLAAFSFLVGYSLELNYMLHEPSTGNSILQWVTLENITGYFGNVFKLIAYYVPRSFSPFIYIYRDIQPYAIGLYALALISIAAAARRVAIKKAPSPEFLSGMKLFLSLLLIQIALLPFFKPFEVFPRYLMPLSIPICALASCFIETLLRSKTAMKYAGAAALALALLLEAYAAADMSTCRYASCPNRKQTMDIVSYLKDNNIRGVYTDFAWKWQILFYSGEEVVCSDAWTSSVTLRTPQDLQVQDMTDAALVIPYYSPKMPFIKTLLKTNGGGYAVDRVGVLEIYHSFEKPLFDDTDLKHPKQTD